MVWSLESCRVLCKNLAMRRPCAASAGQHNVACRYMWQLELWDSQYIAYDRPPQRSIYHDHGPAGLPSRRSKPAEWSDPLIRRRLQLYSQIFQNVRQPLTRGF